MSKFCGNCGAQLEDSTTQCHLCKSVVGENITDSLQINSTSKPKKKKGCLIAFIIVILIPCFLIVVGLLSQNEGDNQSDDYQPTGGFLSSFDSSQQDPTPTIDELYEKYTTFEKSGQCGENAYWKVSSDGELLVVSGTGKLNEGEIFGISELISKESYIKYLIVEEGISAIANENLQSLQLDCLYLPSSLTEIAEDAFYFNRQIQNVVLNNSNFIVEDGVLFDSSRTKIIKYLSSNHESSYTIPDTVLEVCNNAFQYSSGIKKLVIPANVRKIGGCAFAGIDTLEEIEILTKDYELGDSAFAFNDNLKTINLSSGIEFIPDGLFNGCISLKSIEIPDNVTSIGACAFDGCECLESVILPKSVETIHKFAFRDCISLKSIQLPNQLKQLGSNNGVFSNDRGKVFQNCISLTNITIPESVQYMKWGIFDGWTSEQTIYIESDTPSSDWEEEWADNCQANIVWGCK